MNHMQDKIIVNYNVGFTESNLLAVEIMFGNGKVETYISEVELRKMFDTLKVEAPYDMPYLMQDYIYTISGYALPVYEFQKVMEVRKFSTFKRKNLPLPKCYERVFGTLRNKGLIQEVKHLDFLINKGSWS